MNIRRELYTESTFVLAVDKILCSQELFPRVYYEIFEEMWVGTANLIFYTFLIHYPEAYAFDLEMYIKRKF